MGEAKEMLGIKKKNFKKILSLLQGFPSQYPLSTTFFLTCEKFFNSCQMFYWHHIIVSVLPHDFQQAGLSLFCGVLKIMCMN